ncbi:phytoene/squalene synthase family protein [Cumulibacter soli]|uniref:phytoene/squalene synthase family protein n=1 Tax=Cumulibacter soli TaxID=2546344 RepID=UPI001067BA3B|nr:phytoene/squalene synthase family protein [Cumulibacter soli]
MTPELAQSYRSCRALLAEHGRTYHLASRLLPPATRPAVWALYGFARYVDDLADVDISQTPHPAVLDGLQEELIAGIEAGYSNHPLLAATVDTVLRYELDPQWLCDFLDAMRMDLSPREFANWSELHEYTWGSAAVIGLQMARVIGVSDEDWDRAAPSAAALGEAFQITNFCRDYDEDLSRGRIYLPTELFTRIGADPGTRERTAVRSVVADAADYARTLYAKAEPGIALLNPDGQPCIRAAFVLYKGILDKIEAADYAVLGTRHRVSELNRVRVAMPLLARAILSRTRVRLGHSDTRSHRG